MAMKPTEAPAGYTGDPALRPTSPPPPRKRQGDALDVTREFYTRQSQELLAALDGLWSYACTGASVTDVDTTEQPQFVAAALLLEPLWSSRRKASLARKAAEG